MDRKGEAAQRGSAKFFLNVDLELESEGSMDALVAALEPVAYSLERPAGLACFELTAAIDQQTPEPLIQEFARLIAALPTQARAEWDRASRRVFDIGLQSGRQPFQEAHRLQPETLEAVLAIGAEIAITIYALDPADDPSPAG